ncbi:MAG TPA: hypothetical protein VLX09_15010 [Stellaceae bacterium]|nr:hypothetical protein [Stellaceae bacterium]
MMIVDMGAGVESTAVPDWTCKPLSCAHAGFVAIGITQAIAVVANKARRMTRDDRSRLN